jgi:hypothetical protein
MISSGTKLRMRYQRPSGSFVTFANEVTSTETNNTTFRTIVHKDNPGDHDEDIPEGFNGSITVQFFYEDSGKYLDLHQARLAKELITIEATESTSGTDVYTYTAYIESLTKTQQVRESVSANITFKLQSSAIVTQVA